MSDVHVYFVGSKNLTSQTAVAIVSMAMNTTANLYLYILNCDLPNDDINILNRMCKSYKNIKSLTVKDVECSQFDGCNKWHGHIDVWARMVFPDMFPDVQRAIYLDSDILIMGDIQKLYDMDMGGFALAAAPEIYHKSARESHLLKQRQEFFKYSGDKLYFCAGTLLLDCEQWRNKNIAKNIIGMAKHYGTKFKFCDQDALNMFFADNYMVIDNELCSTSRDILYLKHEEPERFLRLQKNIIVRHFNVVKPFSKKIYMYNETIDHIENWWYYAKQTPYYLYFLHNMHLEPQVKKNEYKLHLFNALCLIKMVEIRKNKKVVYLFGFIPIMQWRKKEL